MPRLLDLPVGRTSIYQVMATVTATRMSTNTMTVASHEAIATVITTNQVTVSRAAIQSTSHRLLTITTPSISMMG